MSCQIELDRVYCSDCQLTDTIDQPKHQPTVS